MLTKAIEKLQSEMTANKANSYIQVVGEFLIGHLNANPKSADKILVADKTIGRSLDQMRKAADKKKVGNSAMFTPQEGFEIVMKYFGIDGVTPAVIPLAPATVDTKPANDFDIKLEDLL